jgi:hypothetical protein
MHALKKAVKSWSKLQSNICLKKHVLRFGIAQASTGMAPALAGIVGGRPKASAVEIVLFPD